MKKTLKIISISLIQFFFFVNLSWAGGELNQPEVCLSPVVRVNTELLMRNFQNIYEQNLKLSNPNKDVLEQISIFNNAVEESGKLRDNYYRMKPWLDKSRGAVKALGDMGDASAAAPLIKALTEPNLIFDRVAVVEVLVKIGDDRAREPIRNLLLEIPETVRSINDDHGEYTVRANPYYEEILSALKELEKKIEAKKNKRKELPFQYNVPQGVDKGLVEKVIKLGRIDVNSLADKNLKAFLNFLKLNGLEDVVVIGGTVRDIFFGKATDDLDITVKMELTDEERKAFSRTRAPANQRVLNYSMRLLNKLASALQADTEQFIPPLDGNEPRFNGISVQYAGPLKMTDNNGEEVIVRRVLYDARNKQIYPSNTGAGLLQMAIDCDGNVYGRKESLVDLLGGKIKLYGDGQNFFMGEILRLLRLKHQYGLEISENDYQLVKDTILKYAKGELFLSEKLKETSGRLIEKIMKNARDTEAALRELKGLGILEILNSTRIEKIISDWDIVSERDFNAIALINRAI